MSQGCKALVGFVASAHKTALRIGPEAARILRGALNPKVRFQLEDRSDELRRVVNREEGRTCRCGHRYRACWAVGAQLERERIARGDQESQRPCRLAAHVATTGVVSARSGSRHRLRRAARHGVRALVATAQRGCQGCRLSRGVGRVLVHLHHPDMALPTMAGSGQHRQAGVGPQDDDQRQHERQASPHCAPRNHADLIVASGDPTVCD